MTSAAAIMQTAERQRTRQGYWRGLNDDEVMARSVAVDDPSKLGRLLSAEPQTDEMPEIEFEYDTSESGAGLMRCVHCRKQAPNHFRGFVLQYQNGDRILIGKDCGKKHFGAEWGGVEGDFRAIKARRSLLEQRKAIVDNKVSLIDTIQHIAGATCWGFYAGYRGAFIQRFGALATDEATRNDGILRVEERVRDRASERAGGGPRFKNVVSEVGALKGLRFFRPGAYPGRDVADLCRRLTNAIYILSVEEVRSNHDLKVALKGIYDIAARLNEAAVDCEAIREALDPSNLGLLADWLTRRGEGLWAVRDGVFLRHDASGAPVFWYSSGGWRVVMSFDLPTEYPQSVEPLTVKVLEMLR
jgi:hypothetical protein